jgi:hypothetical protein
MHVRMFIDYKTVTTSLKWLRLSYHWFIVISVYNTQHKHMYTLNFITKNFLINCWYHIPDNQYDTPSWFSPNVFTNFGRYPYLNLSKLQTIFRFPSRFLSCSRWILWYLLEICHSCFLLHALKYLHKNPNATSHTKNPIWQKEDCLCGLVVRVPGYRSRDPDLIPGATRFSKKQWVWNMVHSAWRVQLKSYLEEKVAAPV